MAKILSKSGDSLADVYDIEGSVAGIEDLKSEEVNLVHEMGATIFSERLTTTVFALSAGDLAQNIIWNINFSFSELTRILALAVISDVDGRINNCSAHVTSPPAAGSIDVPIWAWDSNQATVGIRTMIAASVVNRRLMVSAMPQTIPNLLSSNDAPRGVFTLSFRGQTTGFGAGTVTPQMLFYGMFPLTGGVSSRGLPIPGW